MDSFELDSSPNLFILAPDTKSLWIWECRVPHSSHVQAKHWVFKHAVGNMEGFDYSSIKLQGSVIQGSDLENLAEDLYFSHLMVNYQGYSYLSTSIIIGDESFTPQYYRLNDLFSWSKYTTIDHHSTIISTNPINFTWDRCDFRNGALVLVSVEPRDKREANTRIFELEQQNKSFFEKLSNAEDLLKKKDKKIEKLRELLKRYRPQIGDATQVVKNRKRPIDDAWFDFAESPLPYPQPNVGGGGFLARAETLPVYTPVDENVAGMFPLDMLVYVGDDGDFDPTGWSFIRAENNVNGEETMVAFYEGKFESVNIFGHTIGVPYKRGKTFSSTRKIHLANVEGVGMVWAFLYGEDNDN